MQPHRRQPTRLPHPWDSLGKNTGVGCHFLLQCMKVKSQSEVAKSCLTLTVMFITQCIQTSNYFAVNLKLICATLFQLFQLCPNLCNPMTVACQAPLSIGFSTQEYWSGLSFPPPGNLPDLRIKPKSLASRALAGRFFTWQGCSLPLVQPGKPETNIMCINYTSIKKVKKKKKERNVSFHSLKLFYSYQS